MCETAGNSLNVTTVIYFRSNTCYLYQCYPFRKKTQLVEMNKMVTAFPCFNNTYWQKSIQNRGKGKSKKKTVFKYSLLFLYMTISVFEYNFKIDRAYVEVWRHAYIIIFQGKMLLVFWYVYTYQCMCIPYIPICCTLVKFNNIYS